MIGRRVCLDQSIRNTHLPVVPVSPCTLFFLSHIDTHTLLNTHTDFHSWRLRWWSLGEKRQGSVPWRRSSSSGQDSARCNPSQVMLFTFSHFQLICLNAPSSIPKKPPPLLNQHSPMRTTRRREGGCCSTLSNPDHFSTFSLQHLASIWPFVWIKHKNSCCFMDKKKSDCKAHITWIRVASCEKDLLAEVPSAGLFHFFQRREWQGWFKSSVLEHSLSSLLGT